jgi:hypothetical protein
LEREAEEKERLERERRRAEEVREKSSKKVQQQEEEYDFQDVFEERKGGGDKVASFIEEVREQSAQEAELERALQEEAAAMALMGFPGGFDTTKVSGNRLTG